MVEIITVYNSISPKREEKLLRVFIAWELGIGNWELSINDQSCLFQINKFVN